MHLPIARFPLAFVMLVAVPSSCLQRGSSQPRERVKPRKAPTRVAKKARPAPKPLGPATYRLKIDVKRISGCSRARGISTADTTARLRITAGHKAELTLKIKATSYIWSRRSSNTSGYRSESKWLGTARRTSRGFRVSFNRAIRGDVMCTGGYNCPPPPLKKTRSSLVLECRTRNLAAYGKATSSDPMVTDNARRREQRILWCAPSDHIRGLERVLAVPGLPMASGGAVLYAIDRPFERDLIGRKKSTGFIIRVY